ncbi:hypothetical protein POG77_08315 [Lactococcus petauri]|uniref:hypothetical protein n=1 Tax=Lactococcus TaxID=1357 RepID=UPI001CE2DF4A|nr:MULTISPECIES: hypothetical protein [Lactococcus]MDC0814996.1 hypothetical protein [Lactococcus petauri]MDC0817039.1 hypothetical protein [Lactococcus petauri]MDC0824317.1 hypothetical protein [Lactococcus petauri]MDC0830956.1 hypothetical protein [Lactococcus petauri]
MKILYYSYDGEIDTLNFVFEKKNKFYHCYFDNGENLVEEIMAPEEVLRFNPYMDKYHKGNLPDVVLEKIETLL